MRVVIGAVFIALSSCLAPGQESSRALRAERLVQELGEFPASIPASFSSNDTVEDRRRLVYAELRNLREDALSALARGLANDDVRVRRGAALYLLLAGGGYESPDRQKINIAPCQPALIAAVSDADARVRQLSAQAIGEIGPAAVAAVPALIKLLADSDEGSRNTACIGLTRIGPGAKEALPALRNALSDPRPDVRRFAQQAIKAIEE